MGAISALPGLPELPKLRLPFSPAKTMLLYCITTVKHIAADERGLTHGKYLAHWGLCESVKEI